MTMHYSPRDERILEERRHDREVETRKVVEERNERIMQILRLAAEGTRR